MKNNMSNVIFVQIHVTPTVNSIMPEGIPEAYVTCFVGEESAEEALKKIVAQLHLDGLQPKEILEPINQMDESQWQIIVNDTWPEQAEGLFSQAEFESAIKEGKTVYGPFATYDPQ